MAVTVKVGIKGYILPSFTSSKKNLVNFTLQFLTAETKVTQAPLRWEAKVRSTLPPWNRDITWKQGYLLHSKAPPSVLNILYRTRGGLARESTQKQ